MSAQKITKHLSEMGMDPEEVAYLLSDHRAEVLREATDWLSKKYGVTNREAGDLRRMADNA